MAWSCNPATRVHELLFDSCRWLKMQYSLVVISTALVSRILHFSNQVILITRLILNSWENCGSDST
jgi:hypothetical protein